MAFHLANIHDYNQFVAVDIWSHRVRTGIYGIDQWDIVFFSSSSIRQSRKNISWDSVMDMRWVTETIERSYIQAAQKYDNIPDDIILSFSSSGFIVDSVTVQYVRSKEDSVITMQEVDQMIKKIEAESFIRAREKCKQQFGIAHDDIRLVSSTVVNIIIDEKTVTNPIGFPGKNIRLSIVNIFAPASEFNIIRSIISSLGKQPISLIPTPLIFPKLIETSQYSEDSACILDIGHSHTTVLLTENNKIISFETFPIGTEMLVDLVTESHPDFSLIQIENLLCEGNHDISIEKEVNQFLEYLLDVISWFLQTQKVKSRQKHIFCYGGFFENINFFHTFSGLFEEVYGKTIQKHRLIDVIEAPENNDRMLTYWLALIAQELLLVKKDPIVRILRYVLYNYE